MKTQTLVSVSVITLNWVRSKTVGNAKQAIA